MPSRSSALVDSPGTLWLHYRAALDLLWLPLLGVAAVATHEVEAKRALLLTPETVVRRAACVVLQGPVGLVAAAHGGRGFRTFLGLL